MAKNNNIKKNTIDVNEQQRDITHKIAFGGLELFISKMSSGIQTPEDAKKVWAKISLIAGKLREIEKGREWT